MANEALYRFSVFELDPRAGELRKHGSKLKLAGQPIEILGMLLERPGDVVTREELKQRLWPADTFVDFNHSLNAAVNKLREALGDVAATPRFIETLPRKGYRFISNVEHVASNGAAATRAIQTDDQGPDTSLPRRESRRRTFVWAAAAAVVLVALILLLNVAGLRERFLAPSATRGQIRSLAVLPFKNLSGDAEQDYFVDGITEELTTQLAQIGSLRVISRTSAMQYREPRKALPEIGRELGVDAVVEGSAVREGNRVRVSAQLVETATDQHLWSQSYERDARDVLSLQSEVAREIAQQIHVKLSPKEEAVLATSRPVDPSLYQLYLQGKYFQNQSVRQATDRAAGIFQEVIARDPNFALAHAGLAQVLVFSHPATETLPRAKGAAERALRLDPELSESHAAMGTVQLFWDWDWGGSEKSFRRAIELNPGNAEAYYYYSNLLAAVGRFDEAISAAEKATELDPLSARGFVGLGRIQYFARQEQRAIDTLRKALELSRNDYWANFFLSIFLARRGDEERALAHLERAFVASGWTPEQVVRLRGIYDREGYAGVERALARLEEIKSGEAPRSNAQAMIYVRLGERDAAFESLERAFQAHTRDLIYLNVEPQYDPLRKDPRFEKFLRQLNFPKRAS